MSNYQHLLTKAFNTPLAVDASYARTFFSALANRIGGIDKLVDVNGQTLDASAMQIEASSYSNNRPTSRSYQEVNGIAVIPISGSLVHKLGALHPYSGMTGYDGILRKLNEAMHDDDIRGVMLDIDSPGGMVSGCFDLADIIARYRNAKPIWSLGYDMHCSAAQMIASSCSRRLITQTGTAGSVGVIMAHTNIEKLLDKQGVEITLITAGKHKADGNPYEKLPKAVQDKWENQLETLRQSFAAKAAGFMGKDVSDILATEAEMYEGQAAIDIGFADELVNGADAISVMSEHLNNLNTTTVDMGASMTQQAQEPKKAAAAPSEENTVEQPQVASSPSADASTSDKSAVDAERDRVMGIIGLPEAQGREALAHKLAGNPAIDVDTAKDLLAASPAAAAIADSKALAALGAEHGETLGEDVSDNTNDKDADAIALLVKNTH